MGLLLLGCYSALKQALPTHRLEHREEIEGGATLRSVDGVFSGNQQVARHLKAVSALLTSADTPENKHYLQRLHVDMELPEILTREEIGLLFEACMNLKHKAMLIWHMVQAYAYRKSRR